MVEWLAALLLAAAEPPPESEPAPSPSRELLLYLAEFGDAQDRHVDPEAVAEALAPADHATKDEHEPDDTDADARADPDR